jgi:phospholipid/cholesterol/gamma-HCH transport system ATP-binding protein
MTAVSPKISLQNISKSFGQKIVLDDLSLELLPGESLVVIGGSGTGKSVMLKNILGLIRPDKGSIKIDGQEIIGINPNDRDKTLSKIGMLFQNAALFDSLPVWENVAFSIIQKKGMKKTTARDIALQKLSAVGLTSDVADLWPAELSGGMRKRVGLARAIATEPKILFFDEPTTGLDPIMSDVINDLIKSCVQDLGASALSITHDMASAKKIADRIAMLYQGKIIWSGPPGEVEDSGNPYVEQFVNGRAEGPIKMGIRHP